MLVGVTRRRALARIASSAIFAPTVLRALAKESAALPPLPNLPQTDALLLRPGEELFAQYEAAFNARTMVTPRLRALCKTAEAVSTVIDWCRSNKLAFALRSGGHCYEGFSQSRDVVIDTRLLDDVDIDEPNAVATVGAGASLGRIYEKAAKVGLAFVGGSCLTVGISGHVLGGGYGLLARNFGLACDNLLSLDLVTTQGHAVFADAVTNTDLYWASRGGGGGSFGAATRFRLRLHPTKKVLVFRISWDVSVQEGVRLMKAWQAWAPSAPRSITPLFLIFHSTKGVKIYCIGQSTGPLSELRRELRTLSNTAEIHKMDFLSAVNQFAEPSGWNYETLRMKGKSDYVTKPMSDDGIVTLMTHMQKSESANIRVICDPYGGAISDVASNESAFAHRGGTSFCIQYLTDWSNSADEGARLKSMKTLYDAMRPHVSGAAYVNYCDMDLGDRAPRAYWGDNLDRLKQIKKSWDPDNVFRHPQSVPVA